ncbi:MAG: 5'-nucleotidase C-terminal domain-containing protein [Bacteroidales bacterium]|nr:5'-nucleotidase C-terminal domain-containing protein [Bacteroidales bacterium]
MVKTKIILLSAVLLLCSCSHSFKWEKFSMDGHRTAVTVPNATNVAEALGSVSDGVYTAPNGKVFKEGATPKVASLLIDVQPAMARLKEVVAYAPEALIKNRPESTLSNFIVDRLFADVAALVEPGGRKVDVAITNMGGIRVDLAAGDILLDDLVSMLPFRNYLCYVQIPGTELRHAFEYMAESGVQCISGARIVVKDKKLVSAEVGGEALDDERLYGVATIDFLLDGGDGFKLARGAKDYMMTDIKIGDAILADVRALTAEGKPLEYFTDGRVLIQED